MRKRAAILLAPAALLAATAWAAPAPDNGAETLSCVRWRSEARYVNGGYNHVVTLQNGCDAPAVCTVKTNVNPEPVSANIAPGEQVEVLTFRGSPASTFETRVQCALEAGARR
jgi:hypothetical protein